MSSNKPTPKQQKLFGWTFFLVGLPIIGISLGVIEVDESTVHAPLWVIGACGLVFSLAGFMILIGDKAPSINNLFAGILMLCFALIGGWIALFGGDENFSGGISLLSDSYNVSLARILFGSGSLICFAVFLYAMKVQFLGKESEKNRLDK